MSCLLVISIVSHGTLAATSGAAEVEAAVAFASSALKRARLFRRFGCHNSRGIVSLPLITAVSHDVQTYSADDKVQAAVLLFPRCSMSSGFKHGSSISPSAITCVFEINISSSRD